jgi:hypothetical protein
MMVAAIAWQNLNDASRARAAQLLKLNPDYGNGSRTPRRISRIKLPSSRPQPPVGPGAGPYQLDAAHKKNARAEAQARVALAGARLANLINANLR